MGKYCGKFLNLLSNVAIRTWWKCELFGSLMFRRLADLLTRLRARVARSLMCERKRHRI